MIYHCRGCGNVIEPFMNFGRMPIANGFLTPDRFADEYFYELAPAFCPSCELFQIVEQPAPEKMFHEAYAFFTGTSRRMAEHFRDYAEMVIERYACDEDPLVIEIGSNDGTLLANMAARAIRHVGVEPAANVAAAAREKGVETLVAFFNQATAEKIAVAHGHADVVVAANVICHVPDIEAIASGIATLLKPNGVFVFEEPYLGDMIAKTAYDQIYGEHVFIYSARSVVRVFGRHGLELVDVRPQWTHGGSMRYVLAPTGTRPPSEMVARQVALEEAQGLHRPETYDRFRRNCETSRDRLVDLLDILKAEERRVAGYGATSKSTTVLNYCGIGPDHIAFVSDNTPIKQGKFLPGSHIPVLPPEYFHANPPGYAVLFAWNHKDEILANETTFAASGGKWITFVPEVGVLA